MDSWRFNIQSNLVNPTPLSRRVFMSDYRKNDEYFSVPVLEFYGQIKKVSDYRVTD